jgi:hypothetical protein
MTQATVNIMGLGHVYIDVNDVVKSVGIGTDKTIEGYVINTRKYKVWRNKKYIKQADMNSINTTITKEKNAYMIKRDGDGY